MTFLLLLLLLFMLILLSGPRIKLDADITPVVLPDDLDSYLRERESQIPLLLSNTEKSIVWAKPQVREQTEYALVYLHGFSATRQEVAPLCDNLARSLSANLFYTRLSGHGSDGQAMAEISLSALLCDAMEALEIGKRLGKKVILVGNSTGATLATWLALNDNDESIHSLILMSPNFGLKRWRSELLLWPWGASILRVLQRSTYQFEPANALQARYWTTTYPSEALLPMMALIKLVRRARLDKIGVPVLCLYSSRDQVVSVKKILHVFSRLGSRKKVLHEIRDPKSINFHVLAGDILSPDTTQMVTEEIQSFLSGINNQTDDGF